MSLENSFLKTDLSNLRIQFKFFFDFNINVGLG
jgi:hypothetical protein